MTNSKCVKPKQKANKHSSLRDAVISSPPEIIYALTLLPQENGAQENYLLSKKIF